MRRRLLLALTIVSALLGGTFAAGNVEDTLAQGPGNAPVTAGPPPLPDVVPVCPPGPPERVRCHSQRQTQPHGRPDAQPAAVERGPWRPAELVQAYGIPSQPAVGTPIVAVVNAFDNPN